MSPRYMEAMAEVDYIINMLEYSELKKIPEEFRNFILKNKDRRYEVKNDKGFKEETLAILAIIYRKYLASEEERRVLEKEYQENLVKENSEIKNPSNVEIKFSQKIIDNVVEKDLDKKETALEKSIKEVWYKKIFRSIKSIFKIKGSEK